jgi:hypothetical protein
VRIDLGAGDEVAREATNDKDPPPAATAPMWSRGAGSVGPGPQVLVAMLYTSTLSSAPPALPRPPTTVNAPAQSRRAHLLACRRQRSNGRPPTAEAVPLRAAARRTQEDRRASAHTARPRIGSVGAITMGDIV